MKKNLIKISSVILALITMIQPISAYAFDYELDENKNSIKFEEYQISTDEDFENSTNVYAMIASEYAVTIPKTIVLSGVNKSATYNVTVSGDIAGYENVLVEPDKSVTLSTINKSSVQANILQDKTSWKYSEFDTIELGNVDASNITAGAWHGSFNFNIKLSSDFVSVTAFDKNGKNLNTSASIIKDEQKEMLLTQLSSQKLINKSQVKKLIEVETDSFKDLATATFDVSGITNEGEKIGILHFKESTSEWELIGIETVQNGKVSGDFTSFSPVAFVKIDTDGKPHYYRWKIYSVQKTKYELTRVGEGEMYISYYGQNNKNSKKKIAKYDFTSNLEHQYTYYGNSITETGGFYKRHKYNSLEYDYLDETKNISVSDNFYLSYKEVLEFESQVFSPHVSVPSFSDGMDNKYIKVKEKGDTTGNVFSKYIKFDIYYAKPVYGMGSFTSIITGSYDKNAYPVNGYDERTNRWYVLYE